MPPAAERTKIPDTENTSELQRRRNQGAERLLSAVTGSAPATPILINGKSSAIHDIEALQTPEQTAKWLGINKRTLMVNARLGKIPCVRINERLFRFHLPTILAKLQQ